MTELNYYGYVPGLIFDAFTSGIVIPRGTPMNLVPKEHIDPKFDHRSLAIQLNQNLTQYRGLARVSDMLDFKNKDNSKALSTISQKAMVAEVAYLTNGLVALPEDAAQVYSEDELILLEKIGMLYAVSNPNLTFESGSNLVFVDVNDIVEITSGKARIVNKTNEVPIWEEYEVMQAMQATAPGKKGFDPFTKKAYASKKTGQQVTMGHVHQPQAKASKAVMGAVYHPDAFEYMKNPVVKRK